MISTLMHSGRFCVRAKKSEQSYLHQYANPQGPNAYIYKSIKVLGVDYT